MSANRKVDVVHYRNYANETRFSLEVSRTEAILTRAEAEQLLEDLRAALGTDDIERTGEAVIWTRPTRPTRPAPAPVSAARAYEERFRLDERLARARAADNDTARFAAGLNQEETKS